MNNITKTVLFLPFLQIPSGHHQAANALIDGIQQVCPRVTCVKVDILNYSYGKIESLVSDVYLKWIHAFPQLYNFIYQNSVCKNVDKSKRYRLYECLFLNFMKRLLEEKKPDLIVCTHALPAYMLNCLKKNKLLKVPVINVYTDYFIHRFWGIEYIDFHFVSSHIMKKFLLEKGIQDERIFITGIPIHAKIEKSNQARITKAGGHFAVLISGGNLGVGELSKMIRKIAHIKSDSPITYYVLCGKNQKLYNELKDMGNKSIIPLPYIDCREEMNRLYDEIDAILTKPGGVTISESLFKRKPIFIFHALPGQEQINLQQLLDLKLVFQLSDENMHEEVLSYLQNDREQEKYLQHVSEFHAYIDPKEPAEIIENILFGY